MAVLCCQPAMLLHLQDAPVRCYIETTMQHQSAHASDRKGFVIHLGCSECMLDLAVFGAVRQQRSGGVRSFVTHS